MPYADPEKRKQASKKWRDEQIKAGYGKALYARRAARYRNEEILRAAIEAALIEFDKGSTEKALDMLAGALDDAAPVGPPSSYMP